MRVLFAVEPRAPSFAADECASRPVPHRDDLFTFLIEILAGLNSHNAKSVLNLHVRVPSQIPAGLDAKMRKERINAVLIFRRFEVKFRLLVLLRHVELTPHCHRSIRGTMPRNAEARGCKVTNIKKNQGQQGKA